MGASTLYLAGTVTYRTGFNVFEGSTDTQRNEYGASEDLTFVLMAGSFHLALGAASGLVVLAAIL